MAPAPPAGAGFFPLDDALALPPGRLTPQLQEWVVRLGAWVPFEQVPPLLASVAGLHLSGETARRQTEAAGTLLLAAEMAAAPALAPPADPGPATAARLQISADGVMVRLQRGEWVEVKTLAIGTVESRTTRDGEQVPQTMDLSYFARHAEAAEFIRLAVVETHRRGLRAAAAVAGVMDGAVWLQGLLNYHRPDAVRILDLPHAAEHLGALAAGVWGEGSTAARAWQRTQVEALRTQGAAPVLAAIAALAAEAPGNAAVVEHGEYLRKRVGQWAYPAFRAAGWPLGSGIVESGNKLVVEARLKGAGMSWGQEALNPMLALRGAVCSGRWAEAWATIQAGQQAAWRAGRGKGRAGCAEPAPVEERRAPEVNPEVVAEVAAILARVAEELEATRAEAAPQQGKPGPGHPWRRATLSKAR